MKKLSAVIVAIIIAFAMILPAFAAYETGSITVNGKAGATYNVYRILNLESYDDEAGAYSYKAAGDFNNFLNSADIKGTYVNIDDAGYVTWVENADEAEFAALALAYAKENNLYKADRGTIAENATAITFTDLYLGYYLIDSSVGTLCALDTTHPTMTITDKNSEPTIEKKIVVTDAEAGTTTKTDSTTAKTGDSIQFEVTVHAYPGAESYVIHDTMDAGLRYVDFSVSIAGLYQGADYTVSVKENGFDLTFTKAYLDSITEEKDIVVTYSADLQANTAVIAGEGNSNEVTLTYGENNETESSKVTVYTYKVDVVKTNAANKVIDGAKFKLYDADDNLIRLVETGGTYVVDMNTYNDFEIPAGTFTISGLSNGTYKLVETEAPEGYNKLEEAQVFTVNNADITATITDGVLTDGGVQVINNSGSLLPTTGGIGTTIFYIIGAVLVLGAAIFFFSKKRMAIKEN